MLLSARYTAFYTVSVTTSKKLSGDDENRNVNIVKTNKTDTVRFVQSEHKQTSNRDECRNQSGKCFCVLSVATRVKVASLHFSRQKYGL